MTITTRVPFDPELAPILERVKPVIEPVPLTLDNMLEFRERFKGYETPIEQTIGDRPIDYEDRVIPGPPGAPDLTVAIFRPRGGTVNAAGIYGIHGGGMFLGSRFGSAEDLLDYVDGLGVVVVCVEYRLAPEHPDPAPVEDCYAGLTWMSEHAAELGVDPERILVMGASAGGGLSAGTTLLARDRGGPAIAGQGLICPMIDDRNDTVSCHQYPEIGIWPQQYNEAGWTALLGDRKGTDAASPYAAPTRAGDLSGLPPAFIEVGSAEVFRDEAVDYASRLWATGGQAELHVWAGGFHGFTSSPAEVSRAALAARRSWVARVLDL